MVRYVVAVVILLLGAADPSWAATDVTLACPGCCSSHGGITNRCNASNGRVICVDGTTSPTCLCSSCGVSTTPNCTGGQVWNGFVCLCPGGTTLVNGQCVSSQPPPPATITPQTGWWWDPNESGRGFFIQQSGNTIGVAGFIYDRDGRPTWFIATGAASNSSMTGNMLTFRNGQTLTGPYVAPVTGDSLGALTVRFSSTTRATLTWPGGTTILQRGTFGAGSPASPNATGWWLVASEGGRGYSLEVQGNTIFIAAYMYDTNGSPIWYTAAGPYSSGSFQSSWQRFDFGQPMPGPYRAPTLVNDDVGRVVLEFFTFDSAWLTLPDGRRVQLTRFIF